MFFRIVALSWYGLCEHPVIFGIWRSEPLNLFASRGTFCPRPFCQTSDLCLLVDSSQDVLWRNTMLCKIFLCPSITLHNAWWHLPWLSLDFASHVLQSVPFCKHWDCSLARIFWQSLKHRCLSNCVQEFWEYFLLLSFLTGVLCPKKKTCKGMNVEKYLKTIRLCKHRPGFLTNFATDLLGDVSWSSFCTTFFQA